MANINYLIGKPRASQLLGDTLYVVVFGSNEFINNYLLFNSATSRLYTPSQFQDLLMSTFRMQLMVGHQWSSHEQDLSHDSSRPPSPTLLWLQKHSWQYGDLLTLYNLGARKVLVFAVGPLGCIPSQVVTGNITDVKCLETVNSMCRGFNAAVRPMLTQLNTAHPDAKFCFGDAYNGVSQFMSNPAHYGTQLTTWFYLFSLCIN